MTQNDPIRSAVEAGQLMPSSAANIGAFLGAGLPGWAGASIRELVENKSWGELNDRFYRELEFGTGGIRGRTIAAVPTAAEAGRPGPFGCPEHAGVGSNMLSDVTLARAVMGLFNYTQGYLRAQGDAAVPRLVIAHDVRF
jgi:phosphoglucomutase